MAESRQQSLSLPRTSRIKQGRDFARVKARGNRIVYGCMIANWLVHPAHAPTRIGVITSRKIGNAVKRNRARRLLREVFRLHQHDFNQTLDMVLIARPSIARKKMREVEADFLTVLRRGGLLKKTE